MSPQALETLAAIVGAILAVGSFVLYTITRKFGKPEIAFCCLGAILVVVPVLRQLKFKTKSIEVDIQRAQREIAQLQRNLQSVARVQDQILDVQQDSVKVAVAPVKDRQQDVTAVLGQLQQLDVQTSAIQRSIGTTVGQ